MILFGGERLAGTAADDDRDGRPASSETLNCRGDGLSIGTAPVVALLAGISRSGVTMVGGLVRGLDHEDAAKFSFLPATPVILAAGVYKVPDLFGPLGDGIRGQVLAGSVVPAIAAFISVHFLVNYFRDAHVDAVRGLLVPRSAR